MAMDLLQAGVDRSVIALWLGHERVETTQIYLEASLAMKEKALARTSPPDAKPGRYKPGQVVKVVIGMDEFFGALPRLIWHEDEPITWPSSVSLYFVSRLASEQVKVVLTGPQERYRWGPVFKLPLGVFVGPTSMLTNPSLPFVRSYTGRKTSAAACTSSIIRSHSMSAGFFFSRTSWTIASS